MRTIELKTDPESFDASLVGDKPYEIRFNDRSYAKGDVLVLRETAHSEAEMRDGAPLVYTGRELRRVVTEVREGRGLLPGWCVLGCSEEWRSVKTAPGDRVLLVACELDGPEDWRIKCGYREDSEPTGWKVWGASWTPTRWFPLPSQAPKREA